MSSSSVSKPKRVRNAPTPPSRKVLSAYFLFRQEVFSDVRRDNPEARMVDVTRMIGEMWNNLDPQEKEVY